MPTKDEVGRRVRLARFRRNLTLKDVAVRSGMSATHISEIERGKTSPTIGCLQKIAGALEERPAYFVEESEAPLAKLTRRGERPKEFRCDRTGRVVQAETVAGQAPWGTLHIAHGTAKPGEKLHRPPGPGEIVLLCAAGMLRVTVGDESAVLREGDTMHFALEEGYFLENVGEDPIEMYAIAAYPARVSW